MIWTPHCCCWTIHLATVQQWQCPPAAAMIRIILLMMAAAKTMAQLTDDEKKELLKRHNEIRSKVAKGQEGFPKASNMEKMVRYIQIIENYSAEPYKSI